MKKPSKTLENIFVFRKDCRGKQKLNPREYMDSNTKCCKAYEYIYVYDTEELSLYNYDHPPEYGTGQAPAAAVHKYPVSTAQNEGVCQAGKEDWLLREVKPARI